MLAALDKIVERYKNLTSQLNKPDIDYSSQDYKNIIIEYDELTPTIELYNKLKNISKEIDEAKEIVKTSKDEEMKELAELELEELNTQYYELENRLKEKMTPKDPKDEKNAIMEIRAGTGGDEAALFVADLFRMYNRYTEKSNWSLEILSMNQIGIGGYKEIIFNIKGKGAYGKMKYESGVHRVQRVPATETQGRVHTSASSVAVLSEIDEKEIDISPNDLRIDVYRSSGPGGQSVNTTDSAVRVTHIPTGIVVQCQDEKSQHKNKAKALMVLRARLQKHFDQEKQKEQSQLRKSIVGTGDRSEKIRTYNFPQNRVTDHRINLTSYKLEGILDGDLEEFIIALEKAEREQQLQNLQKE